MCPIGSIGRTLSKPAVLTITDTYATSRRVYMKKGDEVHPCPFLADRNPAVYPNPSQFDYARHDQRKSFLDLPHLPFGYGAHLCPGWYLYYLIAAEMIGSLISNYEISTSFKGEPGVRNGFVSRLAVEIPIKMKKRV